MRSRPCTHGSTTAAPRATRTICPSRGKFVDGWQIGEPDQVIYMRDEPYTVPAEGVVDYQYFSVDPGWTEDKWIQATESRPGNRVGGAPHHRLRATARRQA